jgi:hypothetical protein
MRNISLAFGMMATAAEAAKVGSEIRHTGRPCTCLRIFRGFKRTITDMATMRNLEVTLDKFFVDKMCRPVW